MKILNYLSQFPSKKMKLTNGDDLQAPHYRNYTWVGAGNWLNHYELIAIILQGFEYLTTDDNMLNLNNIETLHKINEDEIEIIKKSDEGVYLWRPIERSEVDYVYSLNLDMYVCDRRLESVQKILEDGTMLEVLFSQSANELGKPFKIEHYERGTYFDYYYMVPVSAIDRFEFTISYYDITQFGETPYFPVSHTETHVLDIRNPDMNVYNLIHGHGLLDIDWEK